MAVLPCVLRRILGAGAILLSASIAGAQEPLGGGQGAGKRPDSAVAGLLTFERAVSLFRERGYDLLIADAAVEAAQGNLQSAGQVANPSIGFSYGRGFGALLESNLNAYTVSATDNGSLLDTLLIGKRRLRTDVAEAALSAQRWNRADAERTLVAAFQEAWAVAVASRRQLTANQDIQKSMEETQQLIETRYRAGAVSETDLAVQKTATYEAAQQVESATAAYEQAKVALAFLLGVRERTPQFEIDLQLFEQPLPGELARATPEKLHELARAHRPDLLAQRGQIGRARAALLSAQRQRVPDVSLGLSYAQQGTGSSAVTPPTLGVEVAVTPPILYQQQGEITVAEADLRTQEVSLAKVEAQVLSDVDSSLSAFSAAQRRLFRLDNGYLEQALRARDLTKIQYEKGSASLLELLAAQRQYVTTVTERLQALTDAWTAAFRLESAIGTEVQQ